MSRRSKQAGHLGSSGLTCKHAVTVISVPTDRNPVRGRSVDCLGELETAPSLEAVAAGLFGACDRSKEIDEDRAVRSGIGYGRRDRVLRSGLGWTGLPAATAELDERQAIALEHDGAFRSG